MVVKTARAGLVDPEVMLAALETGRIACSANDMFETEPPAPSSLMADPRVVLTNHTGGFTDASVERIAVRAVANFPQALDCHAA